MRCSNFGFTFLFINHVSYGLRPIFKNLISSVSPSEGGWWKKIESKFPHFFVFNITFTQIFLSMETALNFLHVWLIWDWVSSIFELPYQSVLILLGNQYNLLNISELFIDINKSFSIAVRQVQLISKHILLTPPNN